MSIKVKSLYPEKGLFETISGGGAGQRLTAEGRVGISMRLSRFRIEQILMIEYTIYCDACGEMIDIQSGSARQARKKAKAKGLLIRILRKDYCLRCAEKLHDEGETDRFMRED
jgi:hypothetical protein